MSERIFPRLHPLVKVGIGIAVSVATLCNAESVLSISNVSSLPAERSNTATPTPVGYSFSELWRKYLNVQLTPGSPKGKVVDFMEYCDPKPRSCSFDQTDPDFDKKFHGHFAGYQATFINGKWRYTEVK